VVQSIKTLTLFLLCIFISENSATASATAHLSNDGKTLTFLAHLYFYGEGASEKLLQASLDEINLYWNGSTHQDPKAIPLYGYIGEKKVTFSMIVSGEVISSEQAAHLIGSNPPIGNNFINILAHPSDPKEPHSYMDKICGSTGTWFLTDDLGESTTSAHEFGHGLCLIHPFTADLRQQGAPWIMVPRNSLVDAIYQIDPKARPGKPGGSVNPLLRRVLQRDLEGIYWESMEFNSDGIAAVGEAALPPHQYNLMERVE